jgi:hypothetical protein
VDSLMSAHSKVIAEASRALANAALVLADSLDAVEAPVQPTAFDAPDVGAALESDAPPHGFRRNGTGGLERI